MCEYMCVVGGLCECECRIMCFVCVSTAQGVERDPHTALMLSGNVKPDLLQERHVKINTQCPPLLSDALPFTILSFSSHPSICPSPLSFTRLIFLFLHLPLTLSTRLVSAPLSASHSHIYLTDHLFSLSIFTSLIYIFFLSSSSLFPAPPSLWHVMYN